MNKKKRIKQILTTITLLIFIVLSNSVNAQQALDNGDIINSLESQLQQIEQLQTKSGKLELTVKSNRNVVLKNDMKNMHAVNQLVSLSLLINNMTKELKDVLAQLREMADTDELMNNEDTRNNLMSFTKSTNVIIEGLNEMISNVESSQDILNRHNTE